MLDLTALDSALKQFYRDARVKDLVYKKNPLIALLPKRNDFVGKNLPVPLRYGDPQNRSAQFGYAQRSTGPSDTDSSKFEDFLITRAKNYGFAFLDAETVEAAQSDMGSFVRQATNEINGVLNGITRDLALDLFRDGTGVRGRVSAFAAHSGGETRITLTSASDARNFEVGQLLWAATSTTGAVKSASTFVPKVTRVDSQNGYIYVDADVDNSGVYTGGADWAANDYLFVAGDAPNGASVRRKIRGLEAWLPSTAPTSGDSFYGVDRSVHPSRLAGVRYDGSSDTIEEAILSAHVDLSNEGGSPDIVVMNPFHVKQLLKELGTSVQRGQKDSPDAKVGFKTVKVMTTEGEVDVVSDHNCPVGVGYMLQLDTWTWHTLNGGPRILGPRHDGLSMLRAANADTYEVRVGYYGQLYCDAPGFNARIALPTG